MGVGKEVVFSGHVNDLNLHYNLADISMAGRRGVNNRWN